MDVNVDPRMGLTSAKETILIVDDEAQIRTLLRTILEKEDFHIYEAESGEQGLVVAEIHPPDLVLLDINMKGMDGLTAFSQFKGLNENLPILFLTANKRPSDIIKALNLGATDYITKPFVLGEVVARVKGHLRQGRQQRELALSNQQLKVLSETDDLTGLYNMRNMFERIQQEVNRSSEFGRTMAIIMLDVDNFKSVNDEHEHLFGSYVLTQIGHLIRDRIRKTDFAARYGGDEFLICLTDTKPEGVHIFCEALRRLIEETTFTQNQDSMTVTLSIGAFIFIGEHFHERSHLPNARDLISYADKELYRAKSGGKNKICIRDEVS